MSVGSVLYVLIETKARELEGRTLLSLEAAISGFFVVLGHKGQIQEGIVAGRLPPGIVFDKSITRGKEKKLQNLIDSGCIIVSQDEESGILDLEYDHFLSYRSSFETVQQVSAVFCWGEHDKNAWENRYPEAVGKVHATGSPRVDFWREEFAPFFQDKVRDINARFGDFVLISSNFVFANSLMSAEERIKQGRQNGSIRNDKDEERMLQKIQDNMEMFQKFVDLVRTLSECMPDKEFVVRPHPAEEVEPWEECLSDRTNVHVVLEGGIHQWVRACVAVLHNGCTTGIEAVAVGTPAIAYAPFSSEINREVPNALSIECKSEESVRKVVERCFSGEDSGKRLDPTKEELLRSRLINLYGRHASVVDICAVLRDIDSGLSDSLLSRYSVVMLAIKNLVRKLSFRIRRIVPNSYKKCPGLNYAEVSRIQDDLAKVKGEYGSCTVSRLFGDVVRIEHPRI